MESGLGDTLVCARRGLRNLRQRFDWSVDVASKVCKVLGEKVPEILVFEPCL